MQWDDADGDLASYRILIDGTDSGLEPVIVPRYALPQSLRCEALWIPDALGTISVRFEASDAAGHTVLSPEREIEIVANQPPVIDGLGADPATGALPGDPVTLTLVATDENNRRSYPSNMQILVDGVPVAETAAPTSLLSTTWMPPAEGDFTISALVLDDAGASSSDSFVYHVGDPGEPPTITSGPTAMPSPVTGTSTALAVGASDPDGDDALLIATWSVVDKPTGASDPVFSANGDHAALETTATFASAGAYRFRVTVQDGVGLEVSAEVDVTVEQTATELGLSP